MGTCGRNDSIFDYEGIEEVCRIYGFVNYSNRYVMNGSIIDMDYMMSISLVKLCNLKTIDEYNIDSILIRYKQEKKGYKPASFGFYPRVADYTESDRMVTMISNANRDFAGNIIKQYKPAEGMRMISKIVCVMNSYSTVMIVKSLDAG